MDGIEFSSDIDVTLMVQAGGDHLVVAAARTSSDPEVARLAFEQGDDGPGLIRSLIRHKHGSPFEHGTLTFAVDAPIFVWREHHRHRIGWGYSEESARYRKLRPKFWIVHPGRPAHKPHNYKPMRPVAAHGSPVEQEEIVTNQRYAYMDAWSMYQAMLAEGVLPEVARSVLPVGIYSRGVVTCNPRSLMHFLSLRTQDPEASVPSYPQVEIAELARKYEEHFSEYWPVTWQAFCEYGRIGP